MTFQASRLVTVRMRYPRPDTWFRRDQIDSVNQRIQRGRDIELGDTAIRAAYRCGTMRAKACSALQPMRGFTTDHVKTLSPGNPDRSRSDRPDLRLFCPRRTPKPILKSARNW